MPCCSVILTPFANVATTTVPYSGDRPTVSVSYLVDGVWYAMGVATNIILNPTSVVVTHGGAATGVVKITQ